MVRADDLQDGRVAHDVQQASRPVVLAPRSLDLLLDQRIDRGLVVDAERGAPANDRRSGLGERDDPPPPRNRSIRPRVWVAPLSRPDAWRRPPPENALTMN